MTAQRYGEYSLICYTHPLRGERINLGLAVWHPLQGTAWKLVPNPSRAHCVDEKANLQRLQSELDEIVAVLADWQDKEESPLTFLHDQFNNGLVVTPPMTALVQDKSWMRDRLASIVLPPAPFMRASSTRQFTAAFAARMRAALQARKEPPIRLETDYSEQETFQPVRVAVHYVTERQDVLWRTMSFASLSEGERQLTAAKAVYAENDDLRELKKYKNSELNLAVQLPKPTERASWDDCLRWLNRQADHVETFEDRNSLDQKMPLLIEQ